MKKNKTIIGLLLLTALSVLVLADTALATSISAFSTPTDTLMETLRGPWAKSVAIILILSAAFMMWYKKDDLDGVVKGFLVVVVIISILTLAEPILDALFSFGTGALI